MSRTQAAELIAALRGTVVVSCQAYPGDPLDDPDSMARLAQSAVRGGASAIRARGLAEIAAISRAVPVPVIGLVKVGKSGVFITPTLTDALAVAQAGAQIVAIDATDRPRPDGLTLAQTMAALNQADIAVLADVSNLAEGEQAAALGCAAVSTTLSGYVGGQIGDHDPSPDLDLVTALSSRIDIPIFAEGRYSTPDQVNQALSRGAHCVVVGTAITHPETLTRRFVQQLPGHPAAPTAHPNASVG